MNAYVREGNLKEAKDAIERAQKNIKPAQNARPYEKALILAVCYELVGDRAQAERQYREALKVAGDDSQG